MSEEEVEKKGDIKKPLTKEAIEKINADIQKAEKELVSEETQKKIEEARQEAKSQAEKELQEKQIMAEKEKEVEKLKKKLEDNEKAASERLNKLTEVVDTLKESQAIVNPKDPFANQGGEQADPSKWSDEKVNEIEEKSAEAFFGPDYQRMKNDY